MVLSSEFWERNIMFISLGLAIFCVLGIVFNLLHIPLTPLWFIIIFLILLTIYLKKNKVKFNLPSIYIISVLIIFILSMIMYLNATFSIPYLDGQDSWEHAKAIKYITEYKTAFEQEDNIAFIDPYPPAFDIFMSIMYQITGKLIWTMKFFNVLIICLGTLFFFYFAKELLNSEKKALFATFVIACLPCFFTHYIWAQPLAIIMFFPTIYFLLKEEYWFAGICYAAILTIQPSKAIKLSVMLIIFMIIYFKKEYWKTIVSGIGLASLWWIPALPKTLNVLFTHEINFKNNSGSMTRSYSMIDYIYAQNNGLINSPTGIGIVVCILCFFALIYIILLNKRIFTEHKNHLIVICLWFAFIFIGMNSVTFNLPLGLTSFRFWLLIGIPVSLIATEGLWFIIGMANNKLLQHIIILMIIIGILFTSGIHKYEQNKVIWPLSVPGTIDNIPGTIQVIYPEYNLTIESQQSTLYPPSSFE